MKKLLAVGLMALICCLAIYFASLTGCSAQPTETRSTVMSLRDVRFELGSELVARDSADGIFVDVYRSLDDDKAMVVATYQREDSCVVFIVNTDGDVVAVTKPLSSYTKCLISGVNACKQCHDPNLEPDEYAECVARVIIQCGILTTIFSWFCA